MSENFDWWAAEKQGLVAVREQAPIAVYLNPRGCVVIRQQNDFDDDSWILVEPDRVRALAEAIVRLAEPERLALPPPSPAVKDTTAAERQRRYRERQKAEREAANG